MFDMRQDACQAHVRPCPPHRHPCPSCLVLAVVVPLNLIGLIVSIRKKKEKKNKCFFITHNSNDNRCRLDPVPPAIHCLVCHHAHYLSLSSLALPFCQCPSRIVCHVKCHGCSSKLLVI